MVDQKADKGIEKIEKEEKQLGHVLRDFKEKWKQRKERGNWK